MVALNLAERWYCSPLGAASVLATVPALHVLRGRWYSLYVTSCSKELIFTLANHKKGLKEIETNFLAQFKSYLRTQCEYLHSNTISLSTVHFPTNRRFIGTSIRKKKVLACRKIVLNELSDGMGVDWTYR